MNIKMRVMIYSKKGQMKTYADAIGQATGCLVSDIPPAYPCEKEKLVLIGFSAGAKADDILTRFCSLLSPDRAAGRTASDGEDHSLLLGREPRGAEREA